MTNWWVDNQLKSQIREDITWSQQLSLENATIEALARLKQKAAISDEELKSIYETNFNKLVSGNSDSKNLLEIWINLKSVENKLMVTYLSRAKENSEKPPSAVRKIIYSCCGIKNDLNQNSKSKNIAKWVIDELMAIPELLSQIINPSWWFKNAREFATWLYNALIRNFSQTIREIAKSFTDVFKWTDTPEKQYRTWRSAMLIVLSLIPWAIGKWLLRAWRMVTKWVKAAPRAVGRAAEATGNVAKKAWNKMFPSTAEWLAKRASSKAPKAAPTATPRTTPSVSNRISNSTNRVRDNISRSSQKVDNFLNSTLATRFTRDVMTAPIRLYNWTLTQLSKLVPKRLQLRFSSDLRNIAKLQKEITLKQKIMAKYNKAHPFYAHLEKSIKWLELNITFAKDWLKRSINLNRGVWVTILAANEVNDVINRITSDEFLGNITRTLEEIGIDDTNEEFIDLEKESVNLASWSVEISAEALDYPELENIDWGSEIVPGITITWLASKTWSYEINDRISQQRAANAKSILSEKYSIPEEAFVLENSIQPNDNQDELSQRQWVRVNIQNIQNPSYVEWFDDVRTRYQQNFQTAEHSQEQDPDPIDIDLDEVDIEDYDIHTT